MMNRRKFLKNLAFSSCASGLLTASPFASLQAALAIKQKTLVVIFQRGGCDGLNTCVPYGDENYYALRPTIAIAPPDATNDKSTIDLDGYFGLHPGLSSLKPIYDKGNMAIMPATHYSAATHSHFDGQHFIETAAALKNQAGWLNRYLKQVEKNFALRAVAFSDQLPHSLYGDVPVSAFRELPEFKLNVAAEVEMLARLKGVYGQTINTNNAYYNRLQQIGSTMISDTNLLRDEVSAIYTPENQAIYPDSRYGRQLQQTAQLIKTNLGLEIVTLDLEGWDTHASQGGGEVTAYQFGKHKMFADGIAAFYQDLGLRMQDVVILTCTEFGRTAKENASGGTDHGNASTWFLLGGNVNGGIYGSWPGLAQDQLINGRYLDFSIDYRNILGDVLTNHLGMSDVSKVLLDHNYSSPGLIS